MSVAGVTILGLGVLLGSQLSGSVPQASDRPADALRPSAEPTSETPLTSAKSAVTWLADLKPVDSSSVDDDFTESPWSTTETRVRGAKYHKSLTARGAWCSVAQLVYALDGKYERFSARVALAEDSADTKPLDFYVLADGTRVAEVPNVGMTPQPVELPVAGVLHLAIGIEPPASDPTGCPGPERLGVWLDPSLLPV